MTERDDEAKRTALAEWSTRLTAELGLEGLEVDIDAVLALAGRIAHAVMRPAAPLTTYLVGYAAGYAAASAPGDRIFERAAATATELAETQQTVTGPGETGRSEVAPDQSGQQ